MHLNKELELVRRSAKPFDNMDEVVNRLLPELAQKEVVLLGESSHGTHEFYELRAKLSGRLIEEHDFSGILVEGDWPDVAQINPYLLGHSHADPLSSFVRFPLWMWRNEEFKFFIQQLKKTKQKHDFRIYGLDLYSLHSSISQVVDELAKIDQALADKAKELYSCFSLVDKDPTHYGRKAYFGDDCKQEVEKIFKLLNSARQIGLASSSQFIDPQEAAFNIEQNAYVVKNAESYYRLLFAPDVSTWNIRDKHMFQCLERVKSYLKSRGLSGKVIVWAHNSHLGDARATDRSFYGELNLGQLVREKYGKNAYALGFTTYQGTVIAARNWGNEAQVRSIRPALDKSYEELFFKSGIDKFFLPLAGLEDTWSEPRLERAIGVIYRPETERMSHYFHCHLPLQFDGVIHFNETHALMPLDHYRPLDKTLDTYPFAV